MDEHRITLSKIDIEFFPLVWFLTKLVIAAIPAVLLATIIVSSAFLISGIIASALG